MVKGFDLWMCEVVGIDFDVDFSIGVELEVVV